MTEGAHERASAMANEGAALAETSGLYATPSVLTGLSAWRQLLADAAHTGGTLSRVMSVHFPFLGRSDSERQTID
jgi:hypothetical protein